MVRKRVQRTKRYQPLDAFTTPATNLDQRQRDRLELGEILEAARRAVLTARQDRIIELWMRGWSVPEIGAELNLPVTRVSDEKYKALRKLEHQLGHRRDELEFGLPSMAAAQLRLRPIGRALQAWPDASRVSLDRVEHGRAMPVDLHLGEDLARRSPCRSITKVVRSTPMYFLPYMFFSFQTP